MDEVNRRFAAMTISWAVFAFILVLVVVFDIDI